MEAELVEEVPAVEVEAQAEALPVVVLPAVVVPLVAEALPVEVAVVEDLEEDLVVDLEGEDPLVEAHQEAPHQEVV